ncbi:MAG: flagellar hook assembly protein FlgD [Pseudomonadota bacterium]
MNIDQLFPPTMTSNVNQPKKQLGQDDFMKLLVAQMKNQDPGNPSDNGEFLAQIAQFSMVNGIDKLGTSFEGIAGGLSASQAMQAASLVGRQVLTDSNVVAYDAATPVNGRLAVPEFASGLNIQVRDPAGALVKTIDSAGFKAGIHAFQWDGTNERGETQAAGDYVITATALVEGEQQAVPLQLYNTVESVFTGDKSVELQLAGQRRVNLSQISQYR